MDFLNQAFGIIPKELDGYESTLDSPAFDILQGLNAKYFLEYVSRKEFYLFQGTIANGSRRAKRIHSDTFFNMPIVLPSIAEQEKIGKFFDTLDHTIALQKLESIIKNRITLFSIILSFGYILDKYLITLSLS
ncbi:restriction endonuclease subunit S [Brochothrix campestris]|uniref:restriction endonuclease subunit S n=1 Tax=Brochothrix campestris TaxID=2757 RepID=UPI0004BBF668